MSHLHCRLLVNMHKKITSGVGVLRWFAICGLLVVCPLAKSQNVTFESVKIAEIVSGAYWDQLAPSLPLFMSKLETDLRSANATAPASQLFVQELSRAMTKDNFARAYAQFLSAKLNAEEQRELLVFFSSKVGEEVSDFDKHGSLSGGTDKTYCKASMHSS
jgi:hypothetical protein